jgi:hypothetical protein
MVRMTRSGETRTRAKGAGAGGIMAERRTAQPARSNGADANNSRRESGIQLWYRGKRANRRCTIEKGRFDGDFGGSHWLHGSTANYVAYLTETNSCSS